MADRSSCYVVGVFLLLVVGFSDKHLVIALNNGLALTPPSKFLIWNDIVCFVCGLYKIFVQCVWVIDQM